MGSSLLRVLVVVLAVLAVLPPEALGKGRRRGGGHRPRLTYHGGALLTGQVDLSIMWYGMVTPIQKQKVLTFLRSLNAPLAKGPEPTVAGWWRMVESFQGHARKPVAPIRVNVVSEADDPNASLGKVLVKDFVTKLLPAVTKGNPNTVALIVAAKGISVQEMCAGKCAQHGVAQINGKPQLYIAVGDPEEECPECIWPLGKDPHRPTARIVKAPNDLGADAMVMLVAGGLLEAVINPFADGFYGTRKGDEVENWTTCKGIFGSGWAIGNPGKLLIDPIKEASFNAYGVDNSMFLLPAIFDPRTGKCWTPV